MSTRVSVTLRNSKGDIARYLSEKTREYRRKCLTLFQYVGEQCVNDARLNGSYTDRTGNLRSSIGWAIFEDGKIVGMSDFSKVGEESDQAEGASKDYINELASQYGKGLTLVIVAGMHYAAYVAGRGYNVLDSAEILGEKLIRDLITQINTQ